MHVFEGVLFHPIGQVTQLVAVLTQVRQLALQARQAVVPLKYSTLEQVIQVLEVVRLWAAMQVKQ